LPAVAGALDTRDGLQRWRIVSDAAHRTVRHPLKTDTIKQEQYPWQ
jgi:hypothetical protein